MELKSFLPLLPPKPELVATEERRFPIFQSLWIDASLSFGFRALVLLFYGISEADDVLTARAFDEVHGLTAV